MPAWLRLRAEMMLAVMVAAEVERIADRHHPFTEPDIVGIAE
jgi:hypothetical protein